MDELKLYREMLRIRMVEETIATRYAEQQMRCPVHLSIGQEAVAAGVCAALQPQDYAMSGHRSHAHYLAKGGSLPAMLAEIYGRATGCCGGKGGSMHLVDLSAGFIGAVPIVGSTIPIATGTALTSQMLGEDRVTIAFLGEGATEEGVFHESANFASMRHLPIVFVCENNLYSVYTPMAPRQPSHREVYEQAKGHGIESHQADGNDVVEVQKLSLAAVEKARSGAGPVFLEFKTYRWREHCGPGYDNHIGYRTEEEYEAWRRVCPLERLEEKLRAAKQLTEETESKLQQEIGLEIGAAFDFALSSPYPSPATASEQVYAE
jgi:TPP-dependent pyruvate/acetoin dehydrogenase alpha subunit